MKFKITLLALASAACLTACNDDFFDQVPDDRITIEQVFQRTSYSEKYLATVYSYILNEAHRTSPIPWDPCSDDLDVTYDREDYNSYQINLGNWSASSDYYEFWSHFYRGIRSATYFIQHIGDNQEMLNDPTRGPLVVEQYKNEARFLRAWFYYNLLRQYGPCVLLGDEVLPGDLDRDDVKMNLPRSSYDECVDYIVGELDDIIDNERLPLHFTSQADKDYGRATLAMCMGLKSRVLLLAASPQFNGNPAYANVVNNDGKHLFATERDPEKWKRAADAAKAIIDLNIFDLYKEYHTDGTLDPYMSCRNVFLENWNSEVMMVRIYNNLSSWERSASPRQFSGYESMGATQQLVDAFRMNDGSAITAEQEKGFSTQEYKDAKSGWVFAPAGTRNMFVNREPRFYVNICFNGAYWIGDQKTRIQLYYTGGSGKKGTWDYPRSGYIAIKNVSPSSNPLNNNYIKRPFPDDALCRDAAQLRRSAQRVRSGKSGHRKVPQPDPRTRRPRACAVGPLAGAHARADPAGTPHRTLLRTAPLLRHAPLADRRTDRRRPVLRHERRRRQQLHRRGVLREDRVRDPRLPARILPLPHSAVRNQPRPADRAEPRLVNPKKHPNMNHTKYLALLAGCSFVAACENPVDGDLNVDNPDAYTLVYTVNAVENDSKSTLTFPLERDTVFSVYANLSCIRDPGSDITVEFRTAAELVDAYNEEKQTSYAAMPEACYTIDDTRAVIPNGKYISSPVMIRLNSAAFDGVGTFLLPITIERVTPDLPVSPTLGTAYLRINGTYTTNPFRPIDRSGWSVEAFSTEEPEAQTGYDDNGKAFSAIDDAPCTYWGTQWRNAKPGPPTGSRSTWAKRELQFTIAAVRIRSRPTRLGANGNLRIFNVDVSDDNASWTRVGTFTVENRIENEVYLDHKATARYFRITVTATQADMYQTCIADIKAF